MVFKVYNHNVKKQLTFGALPYREDKNTWFGETQHGKIGFFRSEYVEEVLDDRVDGKFNHVTI